MGLDQYLRKRTKFTGLSVDADDMIGEEVAYWRKANQIREWFVRNTDYPVNGNCEPHPVTKEQLEHLKQDCLTVLANHSKATELLPTSDGFFFGSTDYNDWYYDDLEHTVEMIDDVLANTNFGTDEIVYYEWW